MTLEDAEAFAVAQGWPGSAAKQVWRWVHDKGAAHVRRDDEPVAGRPAMTWPPSATLGCLTVPRFQTSKDGPEAPPVTRDGQSIESVLIPMGEHVTQCISSQVGCAGRLPVRATAKLRAQAQPRRRRDRRIRLYLGRRLLAETSPETRLSNIVYMGMGEPLHNYENLDPVAEEPDQRPRARSSRSGGSPVSNLGLSPSSRSSATSRAPDLAVSLHAPTTRSATRSCRSTGKWNIGKLLAAPQGYPLEQRRRITFEYVLLAGINDSLSDAAQLARLLRAFKCKVNIIPYNPHPEAEYQRPSPAAIEAFQNECKRLGMSTYLRVPRVTTSTRRAVSSRTAATDRPCPAADPQGSAAAAARRLTPVE